MVVVAAVVSVSATNLASAQTAATGPATTTAAKTDTKSGSAAKQTPKEAREAEIAAQTQQLYQLAQELKVEVDKSDKNTLSLAVIKKAAEIEKLARTLKENLRTR
jgi:hypothetical protein